ncbi:MAG: methyltransferase domain-containing protein [Myxococcales bacterium]|nr:MAG: methyltransferase domain-containing protein [Myxococcales bacterium]
MKPELLPLLTCPSCRDGDLTLEAQEEDALGVKTGRLACPTCRTVFPIADYVPSFLPEESGGERWREAWSYKWENVAEQVRYSPEGDEDFERKLNFGNHFSGDFRGKWVLDAGCGSGQDAARMASRGATVVGVDQSRGVYLAQRYNQDTPHADRLHFVRADLFHLPFRPEIFDAIYSNGVLHHTPDTRRAFDAIAPLLKRGGLIGVWVYDRTQYWRLFETFWRPVLSRLPRPALSAFLHAVNRPWHWIYRYRTLMMDKVNPWPESSVARHLADLFSGGQLLYLLTDYHLHLAHRVEDPFIRHHHAFDAYSPTFAWGHDESELFEWFKAQKISVTAISPVRTGLIGVKD